VNHAEPSEEIRKRVEDAVIREIGPIAHPCRRRGRLCAACCSHFEQRGCWRYLHAGQSRNRPGDSADEELI
jgi:hypothetical protein